jgi:hypothetical protein
MSKEFSHRQKFIESCNSLMLELENENLNENIISNFANQLFDNIKTTKEIADFYKKLLTNNNALQYYLTQIKDSIVRNINKINNNYLHKLLTTLNNTVSLKNLVYLSVLSCATSFYIINYNKIPDLVQFFVEILNSKVLNSISIDNIIQFFEMLIKIVGSIVFVYKVLIEPYKNQILSMVGKFNLNKQNTMTESKFTNYKKRNMKKVLTKESSLKNIIKNILSEDLNKFNPNELKTAAFQIKNILKLPITQFVDSFSNIASDAKVQAVLQSGLEDGDVKDDAITYTQGNVSVSQLVPTQNEIGMDDSLNNILIDKFGALQSFLQGKANVGANPIVIYNNKYIIDGHHRWSQVLAANPKATVPVLNLIGRLQPLDVLKIVHLAIATGQNDLPLASAKGINLLLVGENDVRNYVLKNLNEKALEVWQKNGFKDANVIAQHIVNNVKLMQTNGVTQGAPPRTKMPQTDAFETSTNVINKLVKGSVNFVNPEANLKESTNYKKRNMKKVLITESQLRGMVRKMLNEMVNDTSTEKSLYKYANSTQDRLLSQVDVIPELDGTFKQFLMKTKVKGSFQQIVQALVKALKEIQVETNSPQNTINLKDRDNTTSRLASMPLSMNESKRRRF